MAFNSAQWTAMLLRTAPDSRTVTQGVQVTYGLLDQADLYEATDGGGVDVVADRVLTVAAGSISLAVESVVVVGGTSYRVLSQPMKAENGDLVRYRLADAGTLP